MSTVRLHDLQFAPFISAEELGRAIDQGAADLNAKYVTFNCLDRYSTQIDMPSALHPQTILALSFLDEKLPRIYGAPVRLKIPTKLGFKSAKHVYEIVVTNDYLEGFWEKLGYNWFAGL